MQILAEAVHWLAAHSQPGISEKDNWFDAHAAEYIGRTAAIAAGVADAESAAICRKEAGIDAESDTCTVVFLHGLGATAGMWTGHVLALPEFRCLCPDLPGHGSAAGRPWVSMAETVREVAELIERTPEQRAHVVGLSLGGAVAIELMNTRPELLDRVIVDGAQAVPWRFAPLLVAAAWLVSPFMRTRAFMRVAADLLSIGPERRAGFYDEFRLVEPRSFRRSIRDVFRVRLRNRRFDRPVLLVSGAHDIGATRVSDATLAATLPDATAWYVPHTWHAWVGTRPDLHKAMVRAFLTGTPLPGELSPEASRPRKPGAE